MLSSRTEIIDSDRPVRGLEDTHLAKALSQLAAAGVSGAIAVDVADMVSERSYEELAGTVEGSSHGYQARLLLTLRLRAIPTSQS